MASEIRPKCASVNGTWDQVYDEETNTWYCPPDPYVEHPAPEEEPEW